MSVWDYIGAYYKGSLKTLKHRFQAALGWFIFCQSSRFAAYHEQGQAPAPHRSPAIRCSI
ncbi:MAG: hypothetical protein ACFNLD_00125 [Kingella oralis]